MNSKIDQVANAGIPPRVNRDPAAGGSAPAAGTARPATSDSVRITGDAAQLAALDQALSSAQEVDVKKVEAVREALASGSYQIDPTAVADKMTQMEQLLGRGR